jgi:hypothetical protein
MQLTEQAGYARVAVFVPADVLAKSTALVRAPGGRLDFSRMTSV